MVHQPGVGPRAQVLSVVTQVLYMLEPVDGAPSGGVLLIVPPMTDGGRSSHWAEAGSTRAGPRPLRGRSRVSGLPLCLWYEPEGLCDR